MNHWHRVPMKNVIVTLLLTTALALTPGCTLLLVGGAAAAGAGGYAYVNGEAKSTESASLDKTWRAAQAAMKDLQFSVVGQSKDALEGRLTARNATDKKITIRVKKVSDSLTEVRIRVGVFGDESLSRIIHEAVKKGL